MRAPLRLGFFFGHHCSNFLLCGDACQSASASTFIIKLYLRSKAGSPIWCCSRWCSGQSGMHHLSDGLIPVPPSVPVLTCAHSVLVAHVVPFRSWIAQINPRIHLRCPGERTLTKSLQSMGSRCLRLGITAKPTGLKLRFHRSPRRFCKLVSVKRR
jgi:hypothetical protein